MCLPSGRSALVKVAVTSKVMEVSRMAQEPNGQASRVEIGVLDTSMWFQRLFYLLLGEIGLI